MVWLRILKKDDLGVSEMPSYGSKGWNGNNSIAERADQINKYFFLARGFHLGGKHLKAGGFGGKHFAGDRRGADLFDHKAGGKIRDLSSFKKRQSAA